MKKTLVIILTLVILASLAVPAFAAENATCPVCYGTLSTKSRSVIQEESVARCEYSYTSHIHSKYYTHTFKACNICDYETNGTLTLDKTWCPASNMYLRIDKVDEIM